jgi:hypothetical protein
LQDLQDAIERYEMTLFYAKILAHLPYDTIEEPMYIIYWINRNLSVNTNITLKSIKQIILQQRNIDNNMMTCGSTSPEYLTAMQQYQLFINSLKEDVTPEKGNKKRQKSKIEEKSPIQLEANSSSNKLEQLSTPTREDDKSVHTDEYLKANPIDVFASCRNAMEVHRSQGPLDKSMMVFVSCIIDCRTREILLQLKSFLKQLYNLTDDRCAAYNPDLPMTSTSATTYQTTSIFQGIGVNAPIFDIPQKILAYYDKHNILDASFPVSLNDTYLMLLILLNDFNRVYSQLNDEVGNDFTISVTKKKKIIPSQTKSKIASLNGNESTSDKTNAKRKIAKKTKVVGSRKSFRPTLSKVSEQGELSEDFDFDEHNDSDYSVE